MTAGALGGGDASHKASARLPADTVPPSASNSAASTIRCLAAGTTLGAPAPSTTCSGPSRPKRTPPPDSSTTRAAIQPAPAVDIHDQHRRYRNHGDKGHEQYPSLLLRTSSRLGIL